MSKLKAVKPQSVEPTKPKILIFGKPGVGKTFTALDFPNVYYIDSEAGATRDQYMEKLAQSDGVYFGQAQGALNFSDVLDEIKALATEKHQYKTVVIDSLSKLFNHEIAKEQERMDNKNVVDSFGASKKTAIRYCRKILNWIHRLDMNVVLICHEKDVWDNEKKTGVTFDAWDRLEYELDLCLHIIKGGGARKAAVIKTRVKHMPEGQRFDWSFNDFAKLYGEEVIKRDVKTIQLASVEQLAEARRLIDLLKIPAETLEKWFEKAKCQTLDEFGTDEIDKIINFLKAKIQNTGDVGNG